MYSQKGTSTMVCGGYQRYRILSWPIINAIKRIMYSPSCANNTELQLSMIHTDPSTATDLVNLLNNHPRFTKFCFEGNKAMTKECAIIQKIVADATHVTALELAFCKIPMRIGCALASRLMLPKCAITSLVLRNTELGSITAGRLANYLKATTTLTSFSFISDTKKGVRTFRILQLGLEANSSIERLEVRHVFITNGQMLRLMTALFQKPQLVDLVMRRNDIDQANDTSATYRFKFPQFNPSLQRFRFSNTIARDCSVSLEQNLRTNKTLTHVNLSGCNLGTEGVELILAAFYNNSTIKEIDVSLNNASPGAIALYCLLNTAPALKKLHSFISTDTVTYQTTAALMFMDATHNHSNITLLGEHPCKLPGCAVWVNRNISNKRNQKHDLFRVMIVRVKEHNLFFKND